MSLRYPRIVLAENAIALCKRLYERWHAWSELYERKKFLEESKARFPSLPPGEEKDELAKTIKLLETAIEAGQRK